MKVVCIAVLIGSIFAFIFYHDIKTEVLALSNEDNIVYLFQVGVFKNPVNAENYQQKFSNSLIYNDQDYYRVIIGATVKNKDKLANFYKALDINFYIKEIKMDTKKIKLFQEYDQVLMETTKSEVINENTKKMLELFLKNIS